jgi:excisionase family DNA binding protein
MNEFYTPKEISELFKVNRSTISRWVDEGVFPNAVRIGATVRIPYSDIEALKQPKREAI